MTTPGIGCRRLLRHALGNINGDSVYDINDYNLIDVGYAAGTDNDPACLTPTYTSYVDASGSRLCNLRGADVESICLPPLSCGNRKAFHDPTR